LELKLDEKKSRRTFLVSKMVLARHYSHFFEVSKKAQQSLTHGKEECNKYDIIVVLYF
jgi:hypothetical protein